MVSCLLSAASWPGSVLQAPASTSLLQDPFRTPPIFLMANNAPAWFNSQFKTILKVPKERPSPPRKSSQSALASSTPPRARLLSRSALHVATTPSPSELEPSLLALASRPEPFSQPGPRARASYFSVAPVCHHFLSLFSIRSQSSAVRPHQGC